jgi:DTW domain-containing protein
MNLRCSRCQFPLSLCSCGQLPQWTTATRLVLLIHAQEFHRTTNTGRWAHLCLPNSEIRFHGLPNREPISWDGLSEGNTDYLILCLADDALPLEQVLEKRNSQRPIQLLVPDGNWGQGSRLARKARKALPHIQPVKLTGGAPSRYRLRTEHHPDGLSTFEAIARTLGAIEGEEGQKKLEEAFEVLVSRRLWLRGKIKKDEILGGL